MRSKLFVSLSALFMLVVAGCGSGNKESGGQTDTLKASAACIECHAVNKISPVTGVAIVTEWERGAHNTKNGASCPDCHAVNGHPASGVLPTIPGAVICVKCHTAANMTTYGAHFSRYSASYTGLKNPALMPTNPLLPSSAQNCLGCHNPHDNSTLLSINKDWATSKHATISDDAFKGEGGVTAGGCGNTRCHSGTGFRYFMTNNQTLIPSKAVLGSYTTAREVIGCAGCHTDYSYKRISDSASFATFSTPYKRAFGTGVTISKKFPSNIGDTNLCTPCHSSRAGGGDVLAVTAAQINNKSVPSPHYYGAAGITYMKTGFVSFTSASTVLPQVGVSGALGYVAASTYGKSLVSADDLSGGVTSTHRKLGTTAINGDSHSPSFFVPGTLDSGGPCVVCHMKAGHTLKINGAAFTQVCVNCHTSEAGTPLTASNFQSVFLDPQAEAFQNALKLARQLLKDNFGIIPVYDSNGFANYYELNGTTAVVDWTRGGTLSYGKAQKLMGAVFNLRMLGNEPGAYVHGRTYARRLLYDSIDFLDDGQLNMSVGATATAKSLVAGTPVTGLYTQGATAYVQDTGSGTTSSLTTLAPGTSESMVYLIGWDRTTGAWTPASRQRP